MSSAFKDWAEGICNKLDKICEQNVIIQNSSKYINALGEHIQTAIEEVAGDWLGLDCSHQTPISELSLDPNIGTEECENSTCLKMCSAVSPTINPTTTSVASENSTSGHDSSSIGNSNYMVSAVSPVEIASPASSAEACETLTGSAVFPTKIISPASSTETSENSTSRLDSSSVESSTCIKMGSADSPVEIVIPATSSHDSENLSQKHAFDEDIGKLNHHKFFSQCKASKLSCSFDGEEKTKDVLDPAVCANVLSGSKDDQKERVLMHSVQIAATKACDASALQGTKIIGEHEQQNQMENLDDSVHLPELEISGEFEDVNLNDSTVDIEDYVLDFIPHIEDKSNSFKKKFRDAIISKMGLRRLVHDEQEIHFLTTDAKSQNKPQAASIARVDSTKSTLHDLSDSDWVLL